MSETLEYGNSRQRLYLPFLGGFYDSVAQPLAWVGLRVATGGMLAVAGWPKILDPMAMNGFVEGMGFYPGWFWSPLLAAMQFFGGIAIAVGLFTRPIALANAVMLAITLYFHVANPYGDRFLTEAGVEFMKTGGAEYFTPQGLQRLADGGASFLTRVQEKADWLSFLWTGTAAFYAAFGGGMWSIDRYFLRKEL